MRNPLRRFPDLLQRGLDQHLRLAVTGLSRSGKTAFITSLIDQLLHHAQANLPLFLAQKRIVSVDIVPQPDLTIPRFGYEANRNALLEIPPRWCDSTDGISEIRLAIRYQREGTLRHLQNEGCLYLDILDYPGEWLLDFPMLKQDFQQWSMQQLQLLRGARLPFAEAWLESLAQFDPNAPANEAQLEALSAQFTQLLHRLKAEGFPFIQPGRFVLPMTLKGAPVLQFFPLDLTPEQWTALANTPENSQFALLNQRYQHYLKEVVEPFYRHHFSHFDRQVVLADCLTPLNHSHAAFQETKLALQQLFRHFHYGNRSLFTRLFTSKIDKIAFLATKADHITADQLPNLESLMRQLVQEQGQFKQIEQLEYQIHAISAIRATNAIWINQNGKRQPAIQGVRHDGEAVTLYAGEVPTRLPEADFWQHHRFEFDAFAPPKIAPFEALPQLKMDNVLQFLLGDKFH